MTDRGGRSASHGLGDRVYRLALRLLPARFRRRHGEDILSFYHDRLRDAGRSRARRFGIWSLAVWDVVFHGMLERGLDARRVIGGLFRWSRKPESGRVAAGLRPRRHDMVPNAAHDLKYAVRSLVRTPTFSLAFIITIALGIGANTAIFSVVHGVLLRPLPNHGADRIVYLRQTAVVSALPTATFSVPELNDYRAASTTISAFAEHSALSFTMLGYGDPRRVQAAIVSGNYFEVLGLDPVLGRVFDSGDDGEAADPVMVLTHDFWNRVFGGDSSVVGETVEMNGRTIIIVGVLEPAPEYPEPSDVLVNTVTSPHHMSAAMNFDRVHRMTRVFARLAPGATVDAARVELHTLALGFAAEYPEAYEETTGSRVAVTRLKDELTKDARLTLFILLGTAAFVLVIACANVANLTLARGIRRERELVLRAVLGAGRGTLRRLLLTENLLLSLTGAALGLLLARRGLDLLVSYAARFTPRAAEIELNGIVLSFTLALAMGAAIVFALIHRIPSNWAIGSALARASNKTVGSAKGKLQRGLVVAQLAVSFVLLVGAGLLMRTLINLQRVDPGFDVERVLTMDVPALRAGRSQAQINGFYDEVLMRVRALPGVRNAAVASLVPLTGEAAQLQVDVEGYPDDPDAPPPLADYRSVSPDYFRTVDVPILQGRPFLETDHADAPKVVILNQSMADYYFPGQNPVGRRIRWSDPQIEFAGVDGGWRTIVGVVPDTRDYDLEQPVTHVVFQPFAQEFWSGSLLIRTSVVPTAITQSVVDIVREIEGNQPIENVRTLAEIRSDTMAPRRLNATLVGAFALLALVIAAVGVAGVLAFSVSQRTSEFGLRLTLGADQRRLLRMVLGEGTRLLAVGLVVGGLAGLALSRLLGGLLFQIEPTDPVTFVLVAATLATAALGAALAPAWRASRVEPMQALRVD